MGVRKERDSSPNKGKPREMDRSDLKLEAIRDTYKRLPGDEREIIDNLVNRVLEHEPKRIRGLGFVGALEIAGSIGIELAKRGDTRSLPTPKA